MCAREIADRWSEGWAGRRALKAETWVDQLAFAHVLDSKHTKLIWAILAGDANDLRTRRRQFLRES
jgi:hypothetical protein